MNSYKYPKVNMLSPYVDKYRIKCFKGLKSFKMVCSPPKPSAPPKPLAPPSSYISTPLPYPVKYTKL